VSLYFLANVLGLLADASGFRTKLWIGDHLFDVAQPIGPIEEIFAGDRRGLSRGRTVVAAL
jgi:hypothetical protein